jgi:hypothetical protein
VTAPGVCGRRLVASSGGWRQCVAQALAMLRTGLDYLHIDPLKIDFHRP